MTIRPIPLQTETEETVFPGGVHRNIEVRCSTCGRFMSTVTVSVHFDDTKMAGVGLSEHLAAAGVSVMAGVGGKCLRCKEENAQILFKA